MMPPKSSTNIFIILSFFFLFSHEPASASSAFTRLRLLSTDTKTTDDQPTSSILSLTLHPHSSIVKPPQNMKYSDIVLSQLANDHARAHLINSNIQRAISPNSNLPHDIGTEDLESPLVRSGGSYIAQIGVGQPAKEYYLVADTGSQINWLRCVPCDQCGSPQPDPPFDPTGSSSYSPLSCESPPCAALGDSKGCNNRTDKCIYVAGYGDGSSVSIGEFATETVSFGSSGSVDTVPIGCAHILQGRFSVADGILGLGGTEVGFPSQIRARSFSYCLVDRDSTSSSTLEFNSAPPSDSVLVPLIINPNMKVYYYVELTGITINGELVSIPESVYKIDGNGNGGIIVDSGTTLTLLPSEVYNSVRDTFVKYAKNLPPSSGVPNGLDTCYNLSSTPITTVGFPTMSFEFSGGKTLPLRPQNYLFRADSNGKFCLAFMPSKLPVSIFGNNQQQGFRVTYDLANNMFGFSPKKC